MQQKIKFNAEQTNNHENLLNLVSQIVVINCSKIGFWRMEIKLNCVTKVVSVNDLCNSMIKYIRI